MGYKKMFKGNTVERYARIISEVVTSVDEVDTIIKKKRSLLRQITNKSHEKCDNKFRSKIQRLWKNSNMKELVEMILKDNKNLEADKLPLQPSIPVPAVVPDTVETLNQETDIEDDNQDTEINIFFEKPKKTQKRGDTASQIGKKKERSVV